MEASSSICVNVVVELQILKSGRARDVHASTVNCGRKNTKGKTFTELEHRCMECKNTLRQEEEQHETRETNGYCRNGT